MATSRRHSIIDLHHYQPQKTSAAHGLIIAHDRRGHASQFNPKLALPSVASSQATTTIITGSRFTSSHAATYILAFTVGRPGFPSSHQFGHAVVPSRLRPASSHHTAHDSADAQLELHSALVTILAALSSASSHTLAFAEPQAATILGTADGLSPAPQHVYATFRRRGHGSFTDQDPRSVRGGR